MEYLPLGPTAQRVPKIGFGTARFHGGAGVLRRAVELGAGFIDTAESYNAWGDEPGVAETLVAEELGGVTGEVVVATKISPENLRFDDVIRHALASRERLRVPSIDLYQVHAPNPAIPIAETMRALERLVDEGVIRRIGVSNFDVEDLQAAQDALRTQPLVANQVRYNLFDREVEARVLPYCQEHRITVSAHTPLALGRFTGRPGAGVLALVARETNRTAAQIMLNWLVGHAGVMAIPKTDRAERVDELVASVGWTLDPAQRAALDGLT
ncbi:MAG: aldo/keto reductase [Actinobacteria bacterium]|nr:aldo/keto reductase [Actinomycetota bacterium]